MSESDFGSWDPLSIREAAALFSTGPSHWYIGGGLALELFTDRSWRAHDDLDIGVRRRDLGELRSLFLDWDVHVAAAGDLTPWDGRDLDAAESENNLWIRRGPNEPWCLDIQIGDGSDEQWIFRRDPSIHLSWDQAILVTKDGVPYLAPEIQLLFKSKNVRSKDDADAREVIRELNESQSAWLRRGIPSEHQWLRYLDENFT